MKEFFTIPGYEDYEISRCGSIRKRTVLQYSHTKGVYDTNKPGKEMKHGLNMQNYPCVTVYSKCKLLIHIAIAKTFIPNPDNHPVVMHLDDDITNYSVDNLKWGTQKDNMKQSSDTGFYSTVKKEAWLISPDGIITHVVGLRTFCSDNNLDWGNFSKMLRGVKSNNSIKGWRLAQIV